MLERAILLLPLLGLAGPSFGQPDEGEREERPSVGLTPSGLSMDLMVSSAFDTNIEQNDRDLMSRGLVGGLVLRGQKGGRGRFFRVEYGAGGQSYTNTERFDSARNELSAFFFQRLGPKLTAGAIGGYSLRMSTEDREIANQYNAWSQLEYRPIDWARLGLYGAYRSTRVEEGDDAPGQEQVRMFGTDIGFEIGDGSIAEVGYRFERSDSVDTRRRYDRVRLRAEYVVRATRGDSVRIRIERRRRYYPERLVRSDDLRIPREDYRWSPSVLWVHRFEAGPRLEVGYEYQTRTSNDPRRDFERHRFDVTVRVPLVRRLSRGRPDRDLPQPRLPDGAELTDDTLLDQLRYLEARAASPRVAADERATFTQGSSWEDVVAARGLPTRTSERPLFHEERWFYGSSWVVLRRGRVISWHDSGELEETAVPPSPPEEQPRPKEMLMPAPRVAKPTLAEVAAGHSRVEPPRAEAATSSAEIGPRPTPSSAFQQMDHWEIVLRDGRRLDGYVRKYEDGLAHIVLFLPNDRTLLATLPEDLIDRKASRSIATNEGR